MTNFNTQSGLNFIGRYDLNRDGLSRQELQNGQMNAFAGMMTSMMTGNQEGFSSAMQDLQFASVAGQNFDILSQASKTTPFGDNNSQTINPLDLMKTASNDGDIRSFTPQDVKSQNTQNNQQQNPIMQMFMMLIQMLMQMIMGGQQGDDQFNVNNNGMSPFGNNGAFGNNSAFGNNGSFAYAGAGNNGAFAAAGNYNSETYNNSPIGNGNTKNVSGNVERYDSLIQAKANKYGLDPNLVKCVIQQESGGNPNAQSHCGATGLMQLMPGTAREMGCSNPRDPEQNLDAGCKYLAKMMKANHGNVPKALASYNAGLGNVQKYGGVPPFAETQNYVKRIMSNYS